MRMTRSTQNVLLVLAREPTRWMYGLEVMGEAGLASGTVYPLLARLHDQGLLEARQEVLDPTREGRPARTHYRLTGTGLALANEQKEALRELMGGDVGWLPA